MKLIRFAAPGEGEAFRARFGVVVGGYAVPFSTLVARDPEQAPWFETIEAYLDALPESFVLARQRVAEAGDGESLAAGSRFALDTVRLLAPIERPARLYDFALAPRHLQNSARTLLRHEMPGPISPLAQWIAARRYRRPPSRAALPFYLGHVAPFVGPGETCGWPAYSQYVDLEPELAVVCGAIARHAGDVEIEAAIAGYTIFNDLSARDVQFPEMKTGTLGFMRAKHFENGNGLGPWIVTPDELADPYRLAVEVVVGERLHWHGTTADYAFRAEDAIHRLLDLFPVVSGSVIGLGTVPDCCGLDQDDWPLPGETAELRFERIGSLAQTMGRPESLPAATRWRRRPGF